MGEFEMGNYTVMGNLMEYCGEGIRIGWDDVQYADSFLVKDNVIIESKFALFMMNENLDATITENVLIQGKNDALLVFGGSDANWIMMSEEE
jgi:hypothetical protein